ncbi:RNA binding protein, heterogenous nuclear RNP-K like protein [Savitreella phatthalungensis]
MSQITDNVQHRDDLAAQPIGGGQDNQTITTPLPDGISQHADEVAHQHASTDEDGQPTMDEAAFADAQLTLRALVSTKEAGVIIGKGGKNVASLREATGVKAGVSKVVPGVHDRVLTVTGALGAVTTAYTQIAQTFLDNPLHVNDNNAPNVAPGGAPAPPTLRLLISHNLMGTIIGRSGLKIKMIQDASHCRMVASKEMLPQSTERVVEVTGEIANLHRAVWEIGKCLVEDWERGVGTVLYNPAVRLSATSTVVAPTLANGVIPAQGTPGNYLRSHRAPRTGNPSLDFAPHGGLDPNDGYGMPMHTGPGSNSMLPPHAHGDPSLVGGSNNGGGNDYKTRNISIPADLVGCVIGKAGGKITEIRRASGSKIAIAKEHDDAGERMLTVSGPAANTDKALFLIFREVEAEKERRNAAGSGPAGDAMTPGDGAGNSSDI